MDELIPTGKLRWLSFQSYRQDVPELQRKGAVQRGGNTGVSMVLQQWHQYVRQSECAGIDYSNDGKWIDMPVDVE